MDVIIKLFIKICTVSSIPYSDLDICLADGTCKFVLISELQDAMFLLVIIQVQYAGKIAFR